MHFLKICFLYRSLVPRDRQLFVVKCSTTGLNYKMRRTQAALLHLRAGLQGGQMGTDWSNCERRVHRFFLSFGGKTWSRSTGELNKAIRSSIPPSHHLITAASIFAASADNNCGSFCSWGIYENKLLEVTFPETDTLNYSGGKYVLFLKKETFLSSRVSQNKQDNDK